MGRRERAVVGGLLVGLGQTFSNRSQNRIEDARKKRDDALLLLRDEDSREHQRGLLASTQTDEEGNVRGITRGGSVIDLGFKAAATNTRRPGEMTDAQIIADAKSRFTKDTINEGEVTNWPEVDAYLTSKGRPDLASPKSFSKPPKIDRDSKDWLDAGEKAKKWGKDQERWNKFDTTVFEPYGGETQAIEDKTMEYYLRYQGIQPSSGPATKQPSGEQPAGVTKQPDDGATTPDSGTYESADDVGEAWRDGRISKKEAKRILWEVFGI